MCNWLLRIFVVFLILVLSPIAVVGTLVVDNALNPDFYKLTLHDTGFYDAVTKLATTKLKSQVTQLLGSSVDSDFPTDKVMNELLPIVLSASNIQDIVEKNVDLSLSFLDSKTAELSVYLPRARLLRYVDVSIAFLNKLKQEGAKATACGNEQLTQIMNEKVEVTCIPSSLVGAKISSDTLDGITQESNYSLARQILDAPDVTPLTQLFVSISPGNPVDLRILQDVRSAVVFVHYAVLASWLILVVLLVGYVLLGHGWPFRRLKGLAFLTGIVALELLSIGIAIYSVVPPMLAQITLNIDKDIANQVLLISQAVVLKNSLSVIVIGGVLGAISFIVWFVMSIFTHKGKPKQEVPKVTKVETHSIPTAKIEPETGEVKMEAVEIKTVKPSEVPQNKEQLMEMITVDAYNK